MFSVIFKNTVSWFRLPYEICEGYKIRISENNSEYFYKDIIKNPKEPVPFIKKTRFLYNPIGKFELPYDCISSYGDITVFVNNIKINPLKVSFSPYLKTFTIDKNIIKQGDLIECEYMSDRLFVEIETRHKADYKIIPIYRRENEAGDFVFY